MALSTVATLTLTSGCTSSQQRVRARIEEEAIHFKSDGATLSGALYLPAGKPPYPAVVLFHGSGAQPRDSFSAHWFAEQGIAALAYDKRGVGESTGDFRTVPFMELADDGLAAIDLLKARKDIDHARIGVWGLSQGGWLGPLAASRSRDISFVIAVSGPAVSPGEQMIFYYAEELRAGGLSESDVADASQMRRTIWTYLESGQNYEGAKNALQGAQSKSWYATVKAQRDSPFDALPTPAEINAPDYRYTRWFKKEAVYDPLPALKALHVPALFLFADHDRLVQVPETVDILKRLISENQKLNFTIRIIPNTDHGMRRADSDGFGAASTEYLEAMRDWLQAHLRLPRK
ncbi:MAG TPA: alpha/beta hydrolase [Candidatus Acidoferrales bacterium]|nr:alpha/beta hydrolase [Candidatus Acidoferrales bacterium]